MLYEIITPDVSTTAWNLTGGHPLDVISLDGAGIPNITRRQQNFANQHGAIDYGFRLAPRDMTLKLFYNGIDKAAEDGIRDTIYKIFQPFDHPLKLRCTRDDGAVRQIDCHTMGVMDLPESDRIGSSLAFAVRLQAPNPIWYNATQQTHSFTPVAASGASTTTLTYAGSWEEYPILKLYGQMVAPSLSTTLVTPDGTITYQISTSETIPAGDVWTIDLRPGYKTVLNAGLTNKLNSISSFNSYLLNWRLFQAPLKASGANILTLSYTSKDASARLEVLYYNRYLGL